MSDKITIELDGRSCDATPGEIIIAVADREGIAIPRFCYHKKLSIAANCRMCLVEAEQGGRPFPKPVPACATPVVAGMRVQTRSPKALDAQRGTMEFLLINHPLDCPICDQGGECELQDVSMGYGEDISRFSERKRVVKDEDLGPLIATDMTRCIHCTRCVRFCAEIAGVRELGATGRGEDMRIGTFVEQGIAHELSGNVIDLCPVGALTSKPYRFSARAWELTGEPSIAPHDSVGSHLHLHLRGGRVMRVHPRDSEQVNETWISDRDRFAYEGLNSETRLTEPMVKRDGVWHEADWPSALHLVSSGLKGIDADQIGWLMAPNSTLEELYLAQKVLRGLGGRNIDTRLRQQDFRGDEADPGVAWLGAPIAALEQQTALLLIGSDIRHEQPLLAHRVRKAALAGAAVRVVTPYKLDLTHPSRQFVTPPDGLPLELAAIAKALGQTVSQSDDGALADLLRQAQLTEAHTEAADALRDSGAKGTGIILLGALAEADPDYTLIKSLAYLIAEAAECRIGFLPRAANSVGASLAGAMPHRAPGAGSVPQPGLNALAMLTEPRAVYLLWGLDPAMDLLDPTLAMSVLRESGLVVACSAFRSPSLEAVADVMLPIAGFAETSGTFVNASGDWQRFQGAVAPPGEARPGWKVLRVLGNLLEVEGFDYASAKQVHDELKGRCEGVTPDNTRRGTYVQASYHGRPASTVTTLMRVGNVPVYALDQLVRAAPSLQLTPLADGFNLSVHPNQAAKLGLSDGDEVEVSQGSARASISVRVDDQLAMGCGRIPAAVAGSEQLGPQIGPMTVVKAQGETA
ncbi:MAG: NADH-quinone oxidoreductase subunit NuoG [Thiohalocapsa sp.]